MSIMDNFFEDDSLDSNSDDSGHDEDEDEEDDEIMEDTDEMYKKYFGGRSWNGFSELRASMAHGQNIETVRSSLHRSIGPSSDMLQPVVTVKSISCENQSILLAKGWKLGRWEEVEIHNEIHPDPILQDIVHRQPQVVHNHNLTPKKMRFHRNFTPKKGSSPFSRTMSVPDLSRISEIDKPMDDPPFRENMEESMTFLKKLFSHQQEGGITFPTTLLSPPDSRICKFIHSSISKSQIFYRFISTVYLMTYILP